VRCPIAAGIHWRIAIARPGSPPVELAGRALLSIIHRTGASSGESHLSERFFQHTLANGLTLLAQQMPGMQSAAMAFLVPSGAATDPQGLSGSATVLSDWTLRGAGPRDSRQLTDYLDSLGLQRSSSVGIYHMRYACSAVAAKVMEGLAAYADIVRRPHLPDSGFTAARDLALQALAGIDDEPRQRLMIRLRHFHLPHPLGRNTMGEKADLAALTADQCREDQRRRFTARGAILSIAGNVDINELRARVEDLFGSWEPGNEAPVKLSSPGGPYHHEHQESEQTHIGIAYPSIVETDPDYYVMRLAMEVLSGGMSGRLFTEVREKRALVYNVYAGYTSLKGIGSVFGYAGTSTDRAQATLDTFVGELHRLSDGITADELARAKIGLKAASIMNEESTAARAAAMAHDYFMRGRLRTLDEIKAAIDAVTLDQVNAWLKKHTPGPFTIVTIGPKELKLPK
jgi:predicted Zn-dependent peptidase